MDGVLDITGGPAVASSRSRLRGAGAWGPGTRAGRDRRRSIRRSPPERAPPAAAPAAGTSRTRKHADACARRRGSRTRRTRRSGGGWNGVGSWRRASKFKQLFQRHAQPARDGKGGVQRRVAPLAPLDLHIVRAVDAGPARGLGLRQAGGFAGRSDFGGVEGQISPLASPASGERRRATVSRVAALAGRVTRLGRFIQPQRDTRTPRAWRGRSRTPANR